MKTPPWLAVAPPLALAAAAAAQPVQTWARQLGTPQSEYLSALAPVPSGGFYAGGATNGSLWGSNLGGRDFALARYTDAGTVVWARTFGSTNDESLASVGPDGNGGVYAGGSTDGAVQGPGFGMRDIVISRWNSSGTALWIRQLGSNKQDTLTGVLPRAWGGYMVIGNTSGNFAGTNVGSDDFFLGEYGDTGTPTWTRQFGSAGTDTATAIVEEASGEVYIAGTTMGSLGGTPSAGSSDAFVGRYDHWGNQVWVRQFGTSGADGVSAACPDGANGVILVGSTEGNLGGPSAGAIDAFAARYSAAGVRLWLRQYGTAELDRWNAVVRDPSGAVYAAGITTGAWDPPSAGFVDIALGSLTPAGDLAWVTQWGTPDWDEASAVTFGASGVVYVAGSTLGSLAAPNAGADDMVLFRFGASCYPDCNTDGALNLGDFGCFQTKFALGDPYADCNADATLNLGDFGCFQTKFALGCP